MFLVLLRFAGSRERAGALMDGHRAWIQRGLDDGVFLLVGSLDAGAGGGILAHGTSLEALRRRVDEDPFVAEGVVRAEIVGITPSKADPRLAFLAAPSPDASAGGGRADA